jgi:hypothetical protein
MKVTPINRKFGKHAPGDVFDLPDKTAKLMIKLKKVQAVVDPLPVAIPYQTRAMQAAPAPEPELAPYGYKADGTPRKRPGRSASSQAAE